MVVGIVALVAVEDAVGRLLVPVPDLLGRAVDGERRWPALCLGRAVDAVGAVEEWNAPTAEVEPISEGCVRNVGSPRRLEHVERRETRAPDVVVPHVSDSRQ